MRTGNGTPEDFDELFRDYNAVWSFPSAIYPEELYAAYPHAKFILVRAVLPPFIPTHTFPVVLTCTADNARPCLVGEEHEVYHTPYSRNS